MGEAPVVGGETASAGALRGGQRGDAELVQTAADGAVPPAVPVVAGLATDGVFGQGREACAAKHLPQARVYQCTSTREWTPS